MAVDELRAALARTDLADELRQKLQHVQRVLEADSQSTLMSFSMADGEPQAVVAFGDVDHADLIVYLLHGIDTTLTEFPGWADAAQRLCGDVIRSCVSRGKPRRVATIVWFAWDSGSHVTALATKHATVGAARLAVDLDKVAARNPGATIALVTYSYSSTLLGEMYAMSIADRIDVAVSIASAGMTHPAANALSGAIAAKEVVFYATEGGNDSIAPLGRLGQHPNDPRSIPGAIVYESDGGEAPGVDGSTVIGLAVEGHASQSSLDDDGTRHIGYYDARAQSYLTLVARMADAAVAAFESTRDAPR